MERSRQIGAVLMAVSGLQLLLFTFGVLRRSYIAIALPVMTGVAALSGLLFWVGYTMMSMEPDLGELDFEEEQEQEYQAASA